MQIDIQIIVRESVDWIELAQDRVKQRAAFNVMINYRLHKMRTSLFSRAKLRFSRRTLHNGFNENYHNINYMLDVKGFQLQAKMASEVGEVWTSRSGHLSPSGIPR
jgi:hypothetical protein